jgi:hypothetical protein
MADKPWYETTLRWAQTNLVEIDPKRYDGAFWREHWRRTHVQGAIINAGGIVAYYPSKFEMQHRAFDVEKRDLYGEVVADARASGLVVVARMDSNRVSDAFYRAHPDWICLDAEGKPYRQADKFVTCINSPYYTEYLPDVMREIIARSSPDGFTDNSWAGLPRKNICYCRHCREQFDAYAGMDLPRAHDWGDEAYRRWVRWNFERRTELFQFNDALTREAGGENCRWSGMISGDVLHNSMRFIDLKSILPKAAIVMLDHQRRSHEDGFDQNTEAGKRLHGLAGWDKLIPESMPQYQLGAPTFRLSAMPKPEVRLWSSAGFAGGIQPWWHHIGSCHDDRRQYTTAEPIFTWHKDHQDILVDREPVADIGIVWSQENHDSFGRENATRRTVEPYRGYVRALDRAGFSVLPLHADAIAEAAGRFRVIVLPNIGGLTDAQVTSVKAFAEQGGSVVATGDTSIADGLGGSRPDYALGDLFGVHHKPGGRAYGGENPPNTDIETHARHTYLRLAPERRLAHYGPFDPAAPEAQGERHPILAGLEETDSVPFGGHLPEVRLDDDVKVLATFIPDFPIFPPETAWMREPSTDIPAIVLREGTGGGKLIWFIADIDRCFARDQQFEHALLLANAVRHALGDRPVVSVSGGHGFVSANLYRQDGRYILHLNNRLISAPIPGRQNELIALGPVEVTLNLDIAARDVELTVGGRSVPLSTGEGGLSFVVDSVADHEVAVIPS